MKTLETVGYVAPQPVPPRTRERRSWADENDDEVEQEQLERPQTPETEDEGKDESADFGSEQEQASVEEGTEHGHSTGDEQEMKEEPEEEKEGWYPESDHSSAESSVKDEPFIDESP